jgi:autophagy-related protein 11
MLVSLHYQHEASRIASGSLDFNILAIVDTFEGIAVGSRRELEKQATLLSGLEADLDIISRVRIHVEFMSPAVRKSIEAGEKSRTLGDYVSNVKMKQVAETCARTHGRFLSTCCRKSPDKLVSRRFAISIQSSRASSSPTH